MNTNQTIGLIIGALIIIGGAWYLFTPHSTQAPTTSIATTTDEGTPRATNKGEATTVTTVTTSTTTAAVPGKLFTVTYTKNGFNPQSFSVQIGTKVTWVNNSTQQLWVAVASHPDHTSYDGSTRAMHCVMDKPTSSAIFDECAPINPGESWSFTFTKLGSWSFHNHLSPNDEGMVTVIPK